MGFTGGSRITWKMSNKDAKALSPRPRCYSFGKGPRHMHFKKADRYDSACCRDLHWKPLL